MSSSPLECDSLAFCDPETNKLNIESFTRSTLLRKATQIGHRIALVAAVVSINTNGVALAENTEQKDPEVTPQHEVTESDEDNENSLLDCPEDQRVLELRRFVCKTDIEEPKDSQDNADSLLDCPEDQRVLELRRFVCKTDEVASDEPTEAPKGSAFYQPPNILPEENGEIIWSTPTKFSVAPFAQSSASAWKVLYKTSSALNEPIAVSGTILIPKNVQLEDQKIVAFASGTQGMADHCAPSKALEYGLHYEGPIIQRLLNKGWAVAMTDYQGLGTPGEHTYVVGQSLGRSVLDSIRAAKNLKEANLSDSAQLGVLGYSEGGAAAIWASKLKPTYAPELEIKGVVAGGIPADLYQVARFVDRGPFSGLQMYAAIGLNAAYPELNLNNYLNIAGLKQGDTVRRSCLLDGLVKTAFTRAGNMTTTEIINIPEWRRRMEENNPGNSKIEDPIFMQHGLIDEAVPYKQAKSLRDKLCRLGSRVEWKTHVFAEHIATLYIGAAGGIQYLSDRFENKPIPNNCGQPRRWFSWR